MLTTEDGVRVGESKIAAREGISQVVLSRIGMASPGRIYLGFFLFAPRPFSLKIVYFLVYFKCKLVVEWGQSNDFKGKIKKKMG